MWPPSARQINYGLANEMSMVGLRDLFVVAPASSFHHNSNSLQHQQEPVNFDSHSINSPYASTALGMGVGVGVIPLLTATPCITPSSMGGVDEDVLNSNRSRTSTGIQLWQNQQSAQHSNYLKKPMHPEGAVNFLPSGSPCGVGGGGGGIGGSGSTTCQDCGNQAKKDCIHRRCRTCCKSRGFDCSTHVKSTWVPAARRRERQLISSAAGGSTGSTSSAKKPRLVNSQTTTTSYTSTSNNTPPRSFDTSSSHQDASFKESLPAQVRAPAVFKCVRVTSVDDGDDEYAYQATVRIAGHVFKGFLYDQGAETKDGFPNISDLHLCGGSTSGGGRNGALSSSPILDPSDVYAASTAGFLGGSSYENPIN